MASWILIPSLVKLREGFNVIAPMRDKSSDGAVGDTAHQSSQSDHNPDETGNVPIRDVDKVNEVHAIDVDVDLKTPGLSMEKVVQFLLGRCRMGLERRLRYIIFNRRIWQAKNGWRQEAYAGSNPHDHHAHFSAGYGDGQEADTSSWHLEDILKEDEVAFSADDKAWFTTELNKVDENVRATARNSKEFLSDTEKLELRNAVLAEVQPRLDILETKLDEALRLLRPPE